MSPSDPDRWRSVSPYLDQALDLGDGAERDEWLAGLRAREPAIAAELDILLGEHRAVARERYLEASGPALPGAPRRQATLAGQTVGAYMLVSAIGEGGMGAVWLAERNDGRFERRAAIKFLNIALGRSGEQRFTREGVILGRLTHPRIAQLLDAGVTDAGQPYLILEHVDGEHIDQYCRRRELDTNAKVRLVLEVLDAVAYAHANLIVHRDLKPSNVLVDREDGIKLLDFGIAKLMEVDGQVAEATRLTHEGGTALTPDYAAPEQITGAPITTATDVYALGVLLYVLVTGEHPGGADRRSTADMVKAIVESGPKRLPGGDLGTILGKALKKNPQERYASVTALADDLRRYLANEPIGARPDTMTYRAMKFARRHRVAVAAVAVAIAAQSAALYAVNRQRTIAQRRFTQVRQIAAELFNIDVQVRQLPGSSRTRELIVDASLNYLQQLTADAGDDPDLALDVGTAYMRVARVEGVPISANLGQTDRADRHLRMAETFIDRVLAARPGNRTAMLRSAQIAHDRMIVAGQRHQTEEAFALGEVAGRRLQRYLDTGAIEPGEAEQVVITYLNVANRYMLVGRDDEAIRMCRRIIEIANATKQPLQVAPTLTVIAQAERGRGQLDAALAAAHDAVGNTEPPPNANVSLRMRYSLAMIREAAILGDPVGISLGRSSDAIPLLERAFSIADDVAEHDPTDTVSRQRVALAGFTLAELLRDADPERALDICDRVIRRLRQVKNNTINQLNEVTALADSTYPLRALHRAGEARARLDEAFALLAQLKLYPGAPIKPGSETADALTALADHEAAQGNLTHALAISQDLVEQVLATNPGLETDLSDANSVSRLLAALAAFQRRAGRSADASATDARRVRLWEPWEQKLPGNPFVSSQLAGIGAIPR